MTSIEKLRSLSQRMEWALDEQIQEGCGKFSAVVSVVVLTETVKSHPFNGATEEEALEKAASNLLVIICDRRLMSASLKEYILKFGTDYTTALQSVCTKLGYERPVYAIKVAKPDGRLHKGIGAVKAGKKKGYHAKATATQKKIVRCEIARKILVQMQLL